MPEIDGLSLAIAITALDEQMAGLEKQIDGLPKDTEYSADLIEFHFRLQKAAWKLKDAYVAALDPASNWPRYEELVRNGGAEPVDADARRLKLV